MASDRHKEPLEEASGDNSPRHYKTALPKDVPDLTMSTTHRVRFGDRFDTLAFEYYKTPTLWWYIAKANHMVDGTMSPPVGTILFIPRL